MHKMSPMSSMVDEPNAPIRATLEAFKISCKQGLESWELKGYLNKAEYE